MAADRSSRFPWNLKKFQGILFFHEIKAVLFPRYNTMLSDGRTAAWKVGCIISENKNGGINMKRSICVLMVACMLLSLMGCGSSGKLAGTSWAIASGQRSQNLLLPSALSFSGEGVLTITSDEDFFEKAHCSFREEDGILYIEGYHGSDYDIEFSIDGSTLTLYTNGTWGKDEVKYLKN